MAGKKNVAETAVTEDTTGAAQAASDTPAAAPAPKVERLKANGVTRPAADTATGRVWEIADDIYKTKGTPATRAEVMQAGEGEGLNKATIATQYGRWRKFFGLGRDKAQPASDTPASDTPASEATEAPSETLVEEGAPA